MVKIKIDSIKNKQKVTYEGRPVDILNESCAATIYLLSSLIIKAHKKEDARGMYETMDNALNYIKENVEKNIADYVTK